MRHLLGLSRIFNALVTVAAVLCGIEFLFSTGPGLRLLAATLIVAGCFYEHFLTKDQP